MEEKNINVNGNEIKNSFSFAGCSGTEYDLMQKWLNKGYVELYHTAPYYWGLVNYEELKIFTYTEGDLTLINCKDKNSFKKELVCFQKFLEENENLIISVEVV